MDSAQNGGSRRRRLWNGWLIRNRPSGDMKPTLWAVGDDPTLRGLSDRRGSGQQMVVQEHENKLTAPKSIQS
jgi:hypothetical protein